MSARPGPDGHCTLQSSTKFAHYGNHMAADSVRHLVGKSIECLNTSVLNIFFVFVGIVVRCHEGVEVDGLRNFSRYDQ